jgi:hypothetical protein
MLGNPGRACWIVHGRVSNAFQAMLARESGASPAREAVGLAVSPDGVAEVLALLDGTTPAPRLRWERDEPRPAQAAYPAAGACRWTCSPTCGGREDAPTPT